MATTKITTFKGFDKNLQCRGFQYEVGKSFTHNGAVAACSSGFHACEYPLDVFSYYAPYDSRFAVVEQSGEISRHSDDSKVASSKISIKAEIDFVGIVKAAIEYTTSRAKPIDPNSPSSATGYQGASSATGYQGASSATGTRGASSATGDQGASSATGTRGASSATGTRGASSATGYQGASLTTGPYGAATAGGKHCVAISTGSGGKARGSLGCAIVLVRRGPDGEIEHVNTCVVGTHEIKPDVFYTLDEAGDFIEA